MNKYKYRVFYEWEGQTHSNPNATHKNEVQVEDSISRLQKELTMKTADYKTKITQKKIDEKSVLLEVETELSESKLSEQLFAVLQTWDLRANKL